MHAWYVLAGGSDEDIAQIAFGYGLFTGGFGLHYGLEKVGAAVVPMSFREQQERQIQLLQDFGTTLLICTPTYAMYLAETAESLGVNLRELPIRTAMVGGEGHTEELRAQLEEKMGRDGYGKLWAFRGDGAWAYPANVWKKTACTSTKISFWWTLSTRRRAKCCRKGEKGEVVITTLTKQAQPLLRSRTKDLSRITYEPCKCGRTTARMNQDQWAAATICWSSEG